MSLSILLLWLATDIVATYGVLHYRRGLAALPPAEERPPVAILTAIKGVSDSTQQFLEAVCRQQYPAYRLIFALESRSDPALPVVEGIQQRHAGTIPVDIVIAGRATQRAQKVHNLLAAFRTLRGDDAIVVFTDADILPDARVALAAHPAHRQPDRCCEQRLSLAATGRSALAHTSRGRDRSLHRHGGALGAMEPVLGRVDRPRPGGIGPD